jgi:tight adherence protein C
MRTVLAFGFAAAVTLVFLGSPLWRSPRLTKLVDPYLHGLRGRPSSLVSSASPSLFRPLFTPLKRLSCLIPWGPGNDVEERLRIAGRADLVDGFRLEQVTWGVGAATASFVVLAVAALMGSMSSPTSFVACFALSGLAGLAARDRWLTHEGRRRVALIKEQLPAAMDLMTLSLMAGESVPAACGRVAEVIEGAVGDEFRHMNADVRAGGRVHDALEGLARRVPDATVTRFVDALGTAIERGAPLAEVLQGQAQDARAERRRFLLELGGRREIWMLLPIVFLIMPVVVVFALWPGLVSLDLLVP